MVLSTQNPCAALPAHPHLPPVLLVCMPAPSHYSTNLPCPALPCLQLIIFMGICVGWVGSYIYRVATKVGAAAQWRVGSRGRLVCSMGLLKRAQFCREHLAPIPLLCCSK